MINDQDVEAQKLLPVGSNFLRNYPKAAMVIVVLLFLLFIIVFFAIIGAIFYSWYHFSPKLWDAAQENWWSWLPSGLGFVGMFLATMIAIGIISLIFEQITAFSISIDRFAFFRAQENVKKTEDEVISQIEEKDNSGLISMLRYSRAQLDAYYQMALLQTGKSFWQAVIAMWTGFLVMIFGIFLQTYPVQQIGLVAPDASINTLIIASAIIIELISGLFFWLYLSAIGQLTYYFQVQMDNHTSILCYRMAATMTSPDETKRAIIMNILERKERNMRPERPPLVDTKELLAALRLPSASNAAPRLDVAESAPPPAATQAPLPASTTVQA
jgi:hypothetical protein